RHRSLSNLTPCSFPGHVVPVNELLVGVRGEAIHCATGTRTLKPHLGVFEQLHYCIMDQVFNFAGIAHFGGLY
ncbi:MAG: hypothetical protein ACM37Z_11355, partial [Deltaproteobacteria bacterium]